MDPEGQTLVQVGKGALAAGDTGTGGSSCIVVWNQVDRPTQLTHTKCPTRVGNLVDVKVEKTF